MKIVLDTNVIVAAFATQGLCHAVFEMCLDRQDICLGTDILKEVADALKRKLKVPPQVVQTTLEYLREHSIVLHIKPLNERISRDQNDDHIIALAEQSTADYIVSGDQDLLVLKKHKGIPIIQPRQFWEIMKNIERNDG
jgi:putative PIN family toxin of toxin-antitoxin system